MRFLLAFLVLIIVSNINFGYGQDLINRVKQLEDMTTKGQKDLDQIKSDLTSIKKDLAEIKSKSSDKTVSNYTNKYSDGTICGCGCIETGKCGCTNCCTPATTKSDSSSTTSSSTIMIRCSDGKLYPLSAWGGASPYSYSYSYSYPTYSYQGNSYQGNSYQGNCSNGS